ncbi:hypothetical protein HN51_021779 [Arachis hypogaea]
MYSMQFKLLVLGGNGFVGLHICREDLDRGLSVASLSRYRRSSLHDSWATSVIWYKGDSLKEAFNGVTAIVLQQNMWLISSSSVTAPPQP